MLREFLRARRILENQIDELKSKVERGDYSIMRNFRTEYTEEEKEAQRQLKQAELELRNLIYSQINQVIASDDASLKNEYLESIPEKYNDMKLLLSSHTRISDGDRTEITNPCINAEYLTNPDSIQASDNFDNAIALLGADAVKLENLDDMLRISGSSFITSKSAELKPIEIHILRLISSFSSPEVAIGLFNAIYKSPEKNSAEYEELCMNFATSIEQNQALRREMDSDVIHHDDFKLHDNEQYFIINFLCTRMFGSLSDEEKQQIINSSQENALRIKKSQELPPIDKNYIMNKICYHNEVITPKPIEAEPVVALEQLTPETNDTIAPDIQEERILSREEIESTLEVLRILGEPITPELEARIQSYITKTQNPTGRGY